MNRTLAIVIFSAILCGCEHGVGTGSTSTANQSAPKADVWPQLLSNTKSLELGELVLLLMMPDSGATTTGWDYKADSLIKWQAAKPYKEVSDTGYASRQGWIRVNVQGQNATILRERKLELGWSVTYSNESSNPEAKFLPPKFGVQSIDIRPGADGDLTCFGVGFEGCDFSEPFASLVQSGIHVETICSQRVSGGHVSAFILTHAGRKPTVMTWTESGGSGGTSSWITLKLDADRQLPQGAGRNNLDDTIPDMYDPTLCQ